MTRINRLATLALVAALVVGTAVPATATVGSAVHDQDGPTATGTVAGSETNNSSVNVTVGQQLSTVVAATSDEVQTDFEDTAFDVTYETANETERTEAIAERAEALRERAERVAEDYRRATAGYQAGDLNRSEYAQRLAVLNARAQNLLRSYERLQDRAHNVSALELRAAGINRTALNQSIESLDAVTGSGPSALLDRYTGQTDGKLTVETEDGLTIEAESEDGERSLETERSRDANDSVTVAQSEALETARNALQTAENGTWTLVGSSVHADSGYYEFEFALQAANASGDAEVRVDGSSGSIFELEQEVEPAADGDEENEREEGDEREDETEDDRELTLVVAEGTPAPNASITVKALSAGDPAANVTITVDGGAVGTTGDAGTVTLTLPEESATVKAVRGEQETELEFEFEDRDDEVFRQLNVAGSVDNGTASISVTYEGAAVSGAAVYANEERVGTTGGDGTVTFGTNATDELEVEVVKGEFEAELTFSVSGETLTLAEEPHEGDGDKAEKEDERESDEAEDDEEGDEKDGEENGEDGEEKDDEEKGDEKDDEEKGDEKDDEEGDEKDGEEKDNEESEADDGGDETDEEMNETEDESGSEDETDETKDGSGSEDSEDETDDESDTTTEDDE